MNRLLTRSEVTTYTIAGRSGSVNPYKAVSLGHFLRMMSCLGDVSSLFDQLLCGDKDKEN